MSVARPVGIPSSYIDACLNKEVVTLDKLGAEVNADLTDALKGIEGIRKAFHRRVRDAYSASSTTKLPALQEKRTAFQAQFKVLKTLNEVALPAIIQLEAYLDSGRPIRKPYSIEGLKTKVAAMKASQSELARHLSAKEWVATLTHQTLEKFEKAVQQREGETGEGYGAGALNVAGSCVLGTCKAVRVVAPYALKGGVYVLKSLNSAPAVPVAGAVVKDYLFYGGPVAAKTLVTGTATLVLKNQGLPFAVSVAEDLAVRYR